MRLMQSFRNDKSGELHYEPVKLNLYSVIRRFFAWKRIWMWGFCPKCNSDAPELDSCKVCYNDRSSPFRWEKRKQYWNNWKLNVYKEKEIKELSEYYATHHKCMEWFKELK